ncbi:SDR family oxidoreductase [Embleya sp. NPDC008237]|uniref:SDR family oxidoreductase n=1 Tax=Embleya sp. NPDC008237 TaxID=3363978 RepID=UPI0036EFEAD4
METRSRIAVVGATGRAGRHVVDVLRERGYEAVPISRSIGVDVISGEGLEAALTGIECIIDVSSTPSPEQHEATEFFTTSARNLHEAGVKAGVNRMVVASIIGIDASIAGYNAAKLAHEQAVLAGPLPVRILRAAQFHEFVAELASWGIQGDVCYVPRMRTQLIAARAVAEALVDLATGDGPVTESPGTPFAEVAGPREENLAAMAELALARRGLDVRIEEVSDPANPDRDIFENGALLPSPHATLAGPTYRDWLDVQA